MKKGILLLLGMMTLVTSIKADEIQKLTSKIGVYNFGTNAVTFIERGIQFHVFLNGDFDYNTRYNTTTYYDSNERRTRRSRGIRIERDYSGRVRRVKNTFINYNYRGNVKRIGSVFIDYRFGQLVRVGNLRIKYNRWGNPRFYGSVKHNDYYNHNSFNIDIRFGSIWNYDDDYFYRGDFRHNYRKYKEDANYYYYRAKSNAKIGKRGKLLRRRKANSSHKNDYRKNEGKKRKKNRKEYKNRINKSDNNNSQKHRKRRG